MESELDSDSDSVDRPRAFLMYAFPHGRTDVELANLKLADGSKWSHWFARMQNGQLGLVQDHSYSFLPHVRKLLFPELAQTEAAILQARLATIAEPSVSNVRMALADGHTVPNGYLHASTRLTFCDAELARGSEIQFLSAESTRDQESSRARIDWIDAVLFPGGAGILVVALRLQSGRSIEENSILLGQLKKILFRRRLSVEVGHVGLSPNKATGRLVDWVDLLNVLLGELMVESAGSRINAVELAQTLGVNWRIALVTTIPDAPGLPVEPFTSWGEQAAFTFATGHKSDIFNTPSNLQWNNLQSNQLLSLWRGWEMLYHYDNLIHVVSSPNTKYVAQQFENFEFEYLQILILATVQRYSLDLLGGTLAQISGRIAEASAELDSFSVALNQFNTRVLHLDVSTTPVGAPLYALLRRSLGIEASMKQIHRDTSALESHLLRLSAKRRERSAARTEFLVELLTMVGVPLGIAATIMQTQLDKLGPLQRLPPKWAWAGIGILTLIIVAVWRVVRHDAKEGNDDF